MPLVHDPDQANPGGTPASAEVELQELRAEVARLRELVGPSEQSYVKLKTDVWGARDAVIGAEAEAGMLRGRVRSLEAELTRALKEQQWFKAEVINRLKAYRVFHRRVIGKARRTLVK
jgi:predicted  nucleic acid-binding Zn-ribbon protein